MALDRADWGRLDALLEAALEFPEAERRPWLDRVCDGDPETRAELERLLANAESEDGPLQTGAAEAMEKGQPTLAAGSRLGRFELLGLLGSGGMGSVYRARDPALGREVAIKALAEAFRDDADSLRRFEREARVLGALNHPRIAAIYGLERIDGAPYLVLELVAGETLRQRLERGPLPVPEAVACARQVAEALEEAHRQGVVHRDLKPSNVMLASSGGIKVLDFGLAKAARQPGRASASDLVDVRTLTGVILGTAPYMSPEQARGEEVDARSDIWAFGCLVYEMLCGQRAFPSGASVPEILAAVLRDEVAWDGLPPGTPAELRRLLQRCLRKEAHARLPDIADARLMLAELETRPAPPPVRPGTGALAWAIPLCLAALLGGLAGTGWRPAPARPLARLGLDLPRPLAFDTQYAAPFAVAPDGSRLALVAGEAGQRRLHVRGVAELLPRPLPGTEGGWQPCFSPDGRFLAYFADRKLYRVAVAGGPPSALAEVGSNPRGASWADDGSIVLAASQTSGLSRVPATGGALVPLTRLDEARGEESHRWPQVLPGGFVLFTAVELDTSFDEARLEVVSLASGERRQVLAGGAHGRYLSSGHLLFVRGGVLLAVRFDLQRLEVRGAPEVVAEGVRYDPRNGGAHLAAAADVLVYQPSLPSSGEAYLDLVEPAAVRRLSEPRSFRSPRLGPDGSRVAVVMGAGESADLWLVEEGATLTRLSTGLRPHQPAWRPDGHGVTVSASEAGLWQLQTLALNGGPPTVLHRSRHRLYPDAWSPDGRRLVFQEHRADAGWDLWTLQADATGRPAGSPQRFLSTPFHEAQASISPDGAWVAYESDELDGLVDIYVRSFPEGAGKVRLTTSGGRSPRWGRAGELYYWNTSLGQVIRLDWRAEAGHFTAGPGRPAWDGLGDGPELRRLLSAPNGRDFDVAWRGHRLLVQESAAPPPEPPLVRPVVVLGITSELRTRLP
jgi:serine/threonine-protein kinase